MCEISCKNSEWLLRKRQKTLGDTFLLHTVCIHRLKKTADLFLSEFRQISTDFNNLWQVGGKMSEI